MDPEVAQAVYAVGRITPGGVALLGTCFGVTPRLLATAGHVVNHSDEDLVVVLTKLTSLLQYQDTTNNQVESIRVRIVRYDPIHDIALLEPSETPALLKFPYTLGGADEIPPGGAVITLGFPHADTGRLVLTQQNTMVGARILLGVGPIKVKHLVLNVQARPGQSGGPVFIQGKNRVCGMLIGGYSPVAEGSISLGGINPHTLHQTTHAVSAEYIRGLL